MSDPINPDHYRIGRKFEVIDVIEDWNLNYRLGNTVKYIGRNGRKANEDRIEGLRKANWYLEREIKYLEGCERTRAKITYEDYLEMMAGDAAADGSPCSIDLDEGMENSFAAGLTD